MTKNKSLLVEWIIYEPLNKMKISPLKSKRKFEDLSKKIQKEL